MQVANLKRSPVRLQSRRLTNRRHEIFRGDELLGIVELRGDVWTSRELAVGEEPSHCRGHREAPSWRVAVLRLARYSMMFLDSDGVQDFGQVRMFRAGSWGRWYTVIVDGERRYIYEDFSIPDQLEGRQQVTIQKVLCAVEDHLREERLRVVQ